MNLILSTYSLMWIVSKFRKINGVCNLYLMVLITKLEKRSTILDFSQNLNLCGIFEVKILFKVISYFLVIMRFGVINTN